MTKPTKKVAPPPKKDDQKFSKYSITRNTKFPLHQDNLLPVFRNLEPDALVRALAKTVGQGMPDTIAREMLDEWVRLNNVALKKKGELQKALRLAIDAQETFGEIEPPQEIVAWAGERFSKGATEETVATVVTRFGVSKSLLDETIRRAREYALSLQTYGVLGGDAKLV